MLKAIKSPSISYISKSNHLIMEANILLIDMEMIYESLYDVLNQYYKEWQGNK